MVGFALSLLVAASVGYVAGANAQGPEPVRSVHVAQPGGILAIAADGEKSVLSGEEQETYEEYTTSIEEDEVTYEANVDLSAAEVSERQTDLSEEYAVGEPLSPEDLEFRRAYLFDAESTESAGDPAVKTATFASGETSAVPAALYNLNQSFNVTKSGAGATANANGRITGGINLADASWGVSWTTKRTGGRALTKITSSVTTDAFGAVASWPFVGKIYSKTLSATSPKGASSWSFSRSGRVTGAVAYMQMDCRSFVYTSAGSFGLP